MLQEHALPALCYAVAFNQPSHLSRLLDYGVDPNSLPTQAVSLPLIAFARLNGAETATSTSEIITQLLCAGADPRTIPEDLRAEESSHMSSVVLNTDPLWCTAEERQ